MATRPLLIFPRPAIAERLKRSSAPPRIRYPDASRQMARLTPQFRRLQQAFRSRRAELVAAPIGIEPEKVLVIETIGDVESFVTAIKNTPGMQWLGEWDEADIPPDDDFYIDEEHTKKLTGRLYLVMTDQEAMRQLVRLWNRYRRNPGASFERGLNKWRNVFKLIRTVRFWDTEDRIDPELLRFWSEHLVQDNEVFRFHTELWFKDQAAERERSFQSFVTLVHEANGAVLQQTVIPEIAYHAVIAQIPRAQVQQIVEHQQTRLVRSDQVMFFRAVGQCAVTAPTDNPASAYQGNLPGTAPTGDPAVALLDGFPLENHDLLSGRLIVDDPDAWAGICPAQRRIHGTAMSSLLIHGELDESQEPLRRPLYVRPILRPVFDPLTGTEIEQIPEEVDPLDLVHRTVRRMFIGEAEQNPTAPHVRIINLSVCDQRLLFDRSPSPFARLLDFLSWTHKALFVVSAGNHAGDIELGIPRNALAGLTPQQLEAETIRALDSDAVNRRLLSPAEAINVLTIGAVHADASTVALMGHRINPYTNTNLPSPINPLGPGFKRSIKPDIIFGGGRQFYAEKLGTAHANATLQVVKATLSTPGQKVAAPGPPANISATRYFCGTSNSTALIARQGALLNDVLETLRQEADGDQLEDRFIPLLIKALLVHGASWADAEGPLQEILEDRIALRNAKEYIARYLGYGRSVSSHLQSCTPQRATVVGMGDLEDGQAHRFRVPLPPSLAAIHGWRRVTITLCWFSPVNSKHNRYRAAALWFSAGLDAVLLSRKEVDARQAQRGTVQHEIFEGESAISFEDGDAIEVLVNCRANAGSLPDAIPYGLVVSFEVAPATAISLYDQIRTRLHVGIPVITPTPQ
jgi:hypothetical protein